MAVPLDVRDFVAEHGLTERSSSKATARTIVIVALFAGLATLGFAVNRWPVWVAIWFVQACMLMGSYSAMHEAAHATLYPSRRANRVAGAFWASTILVNWSLWRSFHLEHHAHTGTHDDPKLKYRLTVTNVAQYALLPLGGLAFIGELWFTSLGTFFGRFPSYVRTRTGRGAIRFDAVLLLGVTGALAGGIVAAPSFVLHVVVAPMLMNACVVMPLTGMTEHYGCALGGEAFATTRSVTSNRAFRFFVWNNNFHTEHHLLPSVPFHHAPALHAYVKPRLEHLCPSYTRFHLDVIRQATARGRRSEVRT